MARISTNNIIPQEDWTIRDQSSQCSAASFAVLTRPSHVDFELCNTRSTPLFFSRQMWQAQDTLQIVESISDASEYLMANSSVYFTATCEEYVVSRQTMRDFRPSLMCRNLQCRTAPPQHSHSAAFLRTIVLLLTVIYGCEGMYIIRIEEGTVLQCVSVYG
jgi:hypothetical protein